jgi:hypothetical protein
MKNVRTRDKPEKKRVREIMKELCEFLSTHKSTTAAIPEKRSELKINGYPSGANFMPSIYLPASLF